MMRTVQQVLHISRCNKDIWHFGSVTSSRHSKDRIRLKKKGCFIYLQFLQSSPREPCSLSQEQSQKSRRKKELKSKGDFDTAYDVAMCPLKKLIVFQPRDWPCQFYYGQIIYKSPKKFISSYPGWSDSPPQQEHILTGLSSYCYSMTSGITRNLSKNNLP